MKKLLFIFFLIPFFVFSEEDPLTLRDNLQHALQGDYIVTLQGRNYTLLLVRDKQPNTITIEEITVPDRRCSSSIDWKKWVEEGADGNTSWVMYTIDIPSGKMAKYYNFYYQTWYDMSEADVFISKLLNLQLKKVPENYRKKVGATRRIWQPPVVVEGKQIPSVPFEAYTTQWPKDGSELSERIVLIYLPEESTKYPSYFPYWLQINGTVGKAQVRIVDSGRQLKSPMKVEK